MSERQVLADLKEFNGDKSKLMQHYSNKMQEILNLHGGNVSDMPMNPDSEYHQLQHKLRILGRMNR